MNTVHATKALSDEPEPGPKLLDVDPSSVGTASGIRESRRPGIGRRILSWVGSMSSPCGSVIQMVGVCIWRGFDAALRDFHPRSGPVLLLSAGFTALLVTWGAGGPSVMPWCHGVAVTVIAFSLCMFALRGKEILIEETNLNTALADEERAKEDAGTGGVRAPARRAE